MYIALSRYDSMRTMDTGSVLDDNIIAGTIAFVSWLHLCYVCNGWYYRDTTQHIF